MSHPEWALKHKKKNTELRNIRGNYYLYKITSKRVKDKKWPQKITLGQIGVITEKEGLIPTGMKRKGTVPKGKSVYKDEMQLSESEISFVDEFAQLSDPRSERNRLYSTLQFQNINKKQIVMLTFLAIPLWKRQPRHSMP